MGDEGALTLRGGINLKIDRMAAARNQALKIYQFNQAVQKFFLEVETPQPDNKGYVEFINPNHFTLEDGVILIRQFAANLQNLPHTLRGGLYRTPSDFYVNSHPAGPKLRVYFHKSDREDIQNADVKVPTEALGRLVNTALRLGGSEEAPLWVLKALRPLLAENLAKEIEDYEIEENRRATEASSLLDRTQELEYIEERRTPSPEDPEEPEVEDIETTREENQESLEEQEEIRLEDSSSQTVSEVGEYSIEDIEEELINLGEQEDRVEDQSVSDQTNYSGSLDFWSESEESDEIWEDYERSRNYTETGSPSGSVTTPTTFSYSDRSESPHRDFRNNHCREMAAFQAKAKEPVFRGKPKENWPEFLQDVEKFFGKTNTPPNQKLTTFISFIKGPALKHMNLGIACQQCATYTDAIKHMNGRYGTKFGTHEDYQRLYSLKKKKSWSVARYIDELTYFMQFKPQNIPTGDVSDLIVSKVLKVLPEPVMLHLTNYMRDRPDLEAHNLCANLKACLRDMKNRKKYEREIFGDESDDEESDDEDEDEESDDDDSSKIGNKGIKEAKNKTKEEYQEKIIQLQAKLLQKEENAKSAESTGKTDNPSQSQKVEVDMAEITKTLGGMCLFNNIQQKGKERFSGNNRGNYSKPPVARMMPSAPSQDQVNFPHQWPGPMHPMHYPMPHQQHFPNMLPQFQPPPLERNQWATMDLAQQFQHPPQQPPNNPQFFSQPPLRDNPRPRGGYQGRGSNRCYFCNAPGHRQFECAQYLHMRSQARWDMHNSHQKKNE